MKKILLLLLLAFINAPINAHTNSDVHTISDDDTCVLCGMMITRWPGPKGIITIKDQEDEFKFCSTRDMFMFALQPENKSQIKEMLVHDMTGNNWEHPKDIFINAKAAWYVLTPNKEAAMGEALASFETKEAAVEFQKEFKGTLYQFSDIDLKILETGMKKHGHKHTGMEKHGHKHTGM